MKKLMILAFALGILFISMHSAGEKQSVKRTWTVQDSKAYAQDMLMAWQQNQYKCLVKLWDKESNWRPEAYNKHKVMGKHAGGIPQILGLSPKLPAPLQIDRGFAYIMHRYGTPCMAWKFHQRKGWY
jgi:hypothetical protein